MAKRINVTVPNYNSLIPRFEIRDNGNWVRLEKVASELAPSIKLGYDEAVDLFAKKLKDIVKRAIASGTPPKGSGIAWAPHSEATIRRYGAHNIYYLSGEYMRSVDIYRYRSRTLIGLPINRKHTATNTRLTLNQLAVLLEYGGKYIPARPLWRPAMNAVGGRAKLRENIIKSIRKKIMARTGLRANQIKFRI